MENLQNKSHSSENSELVIPEPLQTPFAKPPGYGEVSGGNKSVRSGGSGKRILKWIVIFSVMIVSIIGGYFVLVNYFPQYTKYVQPYLGRVLDPVLGRIQPVLDKVGLAKPITPSPTPQHSPQGSPSISPEPSLAGWKTYQNFEYGFEFKYPGDWTAENQSESIVFREAGVNYELEEPLPVWIKIEEAKFNNISDWFNKKFIDRLENHPQDMPTKEEINLGGNIGIKYWDPIQSGSTTAWVAIIKNMKIFEFIFSIDQKEYNQIISTFKFPPDADSDGLPDVEEPKYGTNPNNPDTDGDTWPDGEEVQNGYNPLGAGRAK